VIPSRYEPCGLTDFIAQLFGNLPVVHHIGGLVKVIDGETGFAYHDNSPEVLCDAMHAAREVFQDKGRMRAMQTAAVTKIVEQHTWQTVVDSYVRLYKASRGNEQIHKHAAR
jgi:starch synthase